MATLEDALAVPDRTNMPGTTTQYPNWSLALPGGIEALRRAELPRRIAAVRLARESLRVRRLGSAPHRVPRLIPREGLPKEGASPNNWRWKEVAMNDTNDTFQQRVRAAAVAGWWTLLIAVGFIVLQWIVYLAVMSARPAWFLSMWGPDVDWTFVEQVWFWAIAVLKFALWLMASIVVWLTLWAWQLRTRPDPR